MARPKKGTEKRRPAQVAIRVSHDLKQRLQQIAEAKGVPMSDIGVIALEQYADREEDALYR